MMIPVDNHLPEVRRLTALGWGNRRIGTKLGIGKDAAFRLMKKVELERAQLIVGMKIVGPLALFETARQALAQARNVDEVMAVRDQAERLKLYAKQAKDRTLVADAAEINLRAERKLGGMIASAKAAGEIAEGRPRKKGTESEQFSRVTLEEAGIDRKLSAKSQKIAALPESAFEETINQARDKIVSGAALVIDRPAATAEKKERRATRERVLGEIQSALPQRKYGVILADPEWRFEAWSRETGMDRSADNHYPTSVTEVIAARDVASIAAADCVLFLWATIPMLPQALVVMGAWGFDYKSHYAWIKDKAGMGFWGREKHELLLIGTRGNVPCPAHGTQWDSWFISERKAHSEKPSWALEMIEEYFPTLPKIELNRRGPARLGWDSWGNEAQANYRFARQAHG